MAENRAGPPKLKVSGDPELIKLVEDALKEVYDPEIPVDIFNLGLVYEIEATKENGKPKVRVLMTLTAVGCPVTGSILGYVEQAILDRVPGISEDDIEIDVTFDPPWSPDMVSEEGRELLKEVYGYDVVEEWKQRYQQMNEEQSPQQGNA
ncbi:Phenylacetic acid degradation protein [Acidilobus saccharovorans 345-15]|uniref:Phenylacetic acid degradation protein n=1 Tax=Acidilobus saccharovorans (strain DSM 16705 / JCM 18335 / VKM B-2471 / 345-15) TaxID=666510 RepID=D9Q0P8_ACIS3|nr:iron-sulfur cluster assembly protein [Acidilobus saccharovorans]ADL18886.1 Phenylacetic acid degradation protein [Acidilobus saccharovorans 345-15]